MDWQITNATLATPEIRKTAGLLFSRGRIEEILEPGQANADIPNLNLHGLTVIPGLINSHETLMATWSPVKGENWPHTNWLSYDVDLKRSSQFRERSLLEIETLYHLGAYKNLVSGATSVVDHIPAFVRNPFQDNLPVDLLHDFGLSHSICSYSLNWGEGIKVEHDRAVKNGLPYITHIAEGFDPESELSLKVLARAGCLTSNTVLVHGLSLKADDLDLIAAADAHFVWCPSQNLALYGKTVQIDQFLSRGINVCLGTDASMTGSKSMLEELQTAARIYKEQTGNEIDPNTLLSMATTGPARAFRWENKGSLEAESDGDCVIFSGTGDPLSVIQSSGLKDVYLVVKNGLPVYGNQDLEKLFVSAGIQFDKIEVGGAPKIIQKGMKKLLESVEKATEKNLPDFLPFRVPKG